MAKPSQVFPIRSLGAISSQAETTQLGILLQAARNAFLRPEGGFKGLPKYDRLWSIGSTISVHDTITKQIPHPDGGTLSTHTAASPSQQFAAWTGPTLYLGMPMRWPSTAPGGITVGQVYYVSELLSATDFRVSATLGGDSILTTGPNATYTVELLNLLTTADNTVAMQIANQGKNFLFFYSIDDQKSRGLFYLGDDGTFTSGDYDFTTGTPVWTVLATGLDDTARWFASRQYSALFLGNGVDANVIAQLGRSKTPGVWRKAGSNAAPGTPSISLVQPATTENVQARWDVPGRTGGVAFSFIADADNFPGASGNSRIQVTITNAGISQGIASSLSGVGTVAQPYDYVLTAGTAAAESSNDALKAFVNADSKALSILSVVADASSAADVDDYGPTLLTGGSGAGVSTGFTNRTVTVYARYFDSGADNLGYEGISSPISNTIVIDAASNKDLRVLIPVDASAESGRFDFIRLYMQFGEELEASWFLMDPDNPTPNGITEAIATSAVSTANDEITLTNANWAENDVVHLSTTGSLPDPFLPATDYYLRPGTEAGKWGLANTLDGEARNITAVGTGTHTVTLQKKCVQIGTNTLLGQEIYVDQNRPLPHAHHAMAAQQLWRAGVTDYPSRLYVSKPATDDELVPEGCNLEAFELVHLTSTVTADQKVTGLYSDAQQLHIHLPSGIMVLRQPGLDPTDRYEPAVAAGALSGAAMAVYQRDGLYYYLGGDLRVYSAALSGDGTQYGRLASVAIDDTTLAYVRSKVDLTAIERSPDRANVFYVPGDQMLWYFLPATDGSLKGFAYDHLAGGLVGEFDYPKIAASARMEPNRPELIFCDEEGNLFTWDTSNQQDRGDSFGEQGAFTSYSTGVSVPVQYNGYGYVDYDHDGDGTASRFYQAYETIVETGMIDLDQPAVKKAFMTLLWRLVTGSRGFLEVTLTSLSGQTTTLSFGDIGALTRADQRLPIRLSDTAVKVKLRLIGAEQKAWILRDFALLYQPQSRV